MRMKGIAEHGGRLLTNALSSGVCAVALMMSSTAGAQAADQVAAGAPTSDEAADSIGEIIVTAERRSESLQKTSIAISVLSPDNLERGGLTSASGLSTLTPGIQIGGNGAFTQIFIRGIGDRSNTHLSNASVSTNLDGIPLLRSTEVNGNFFDLQRVEVLKGPQGTLYGRNATGGALNIVTRRPTQELGGYLSGEIGSYELVKVGGAVNIPASDALAFRGAFQIISREGYLSDGTSDDIQQNVRLSVLWEPSSNISLFLSGGYSHQGGKGSGLALIYPLCSTGTCLDPYTGITDQVANTVRLNNDLPASSSLLSYPVPGSPQRLNNRLAYILAELNWDLGPATLTVLPSYVRNHYDSITYPGLLFGNNLVAKQASIEARLSNESPILKWVAGVFYAHENQTGNGPVQQNAAGTGASQFNVIPGDGASIDSKAVFGQATFSVTPSFRVLGGIRYTDETSGLNQKVYNCDNTACPGALKFVIDNRKVNTKKATWKGGIEYDLSPTNFFYATYSTGFKAAGLFAAPITDPSYKPERIEAYQVGLRNRFLNGKIQVNLEAFRWNYSNQVYNFVGPVPGSGFVTLAFINIGKGYVQGLSADLAAKPWHGATVTFAAEYADSKYQDFKYDALAGTKGAANTACAVGAAHPGASGVSVQTVDCSGFPFILASKWSGAASFNQEFGLSNGGNIRLGAVATFNSKRYSQFDFFPTQLLPKAAVVNLDAAYESSNAAWTVRVYVQNLTDKVTYSQSQSLTGTGRATIPAGGPVIAGAIGAPRRFGASFEVKF